MRVEEKNKEYLPGLHTLRFFAALLVLLFHCNDALNQIDSGLSFNSAILTKGHRAVDFFFILSGFLITYLALKELKVNGFFAIKKFLRRRFLRIAPLYFLAVVLGFILIGFLYPRIYGESIFKFSIAEGLIHYIFYMPNVMAARFAEVGPLRSLWSIGVEEQFYLVFPIMLLMGTKMKNHIMPIVLFFILSIAVYTYFYLDVNSVWRRFFVSHLRVHFILWGCILGWLFYNRDSYYKLLNILVHPFVQAAIWLGLIGLLFIHNKYDYHNFISGLLFGFVLLILSSKKSYVDLEWRPLVYLGTVSYGIYIFHPYVSVVLRFVMQKLTFLNGLIARIPFLFFIMVFLITILVAHISYKYYESYFLRKKRH